jgi:AcrR family transcriptional regulator
MTPSVSQSSRQPGRAVAGRPLRRDAARNRQRILRAAAEVFTEHGLQASLDDVARHAGVGVGTVYRRFPDKEALAEALFEERLAALVGLAEQALAEPDAWVGLVSSSCWRR